MMLGIIDGNQEHWKSRTLNIANNLKTLWNFLSSTKTQDAYLIWKFERFSLKVTSGKKRNLAISLIAANDFKYMGLFKESIDRTFETSRVVFLRKSEILRSEELCIRNRRFEQVKKGCFQCKTYSKWEQFSSSKQIKGTRLDLRGCVTDKYFRKHLFLQ